MTSHSAVENLVKAGIHFDFAVALASRANKPKQEQDGFQLDQLRCWKPLE
jgi:hypothetical protein